MTEKQKQDLLQELNKVKFILNLVVSYFLPLKHYSDF